MSENSKNYSNGDVTIVWQPDLCIHSKICWTGLVEVFNPRNRPWVNMQGADTERIKAQVDKCPSGALSYIMNEELKKGEEVTVDTIVEVMPNGPLLVYGNITVKGKNGEETKKNKVTALCRCGQSANKPYCDGSHTKTGFKDE
jgi:Uncharacterized conserved protein